MHIKNFGSQHFADYQRQVERGGRFVFFQFSVSILLYTFRSSSPIFLIRGGHTPFKHAISYSLISIVAGWWGFPWGPVYTVQSLINNFKGGIDVTNEVMEFYNKQLNPRNQYF